jgi:hypothetical protein
MNRVWLNGERSGDHHLLDTRSGEVVKSVRLAHEIRTTAGMGQWVGRRFVAVYVEGDRETVTLQVGERRFPFDGDTVLRHDRKIGGLASRLTIERPGAPPLILRQTNLVGSVLRKVDPAYDDLDASLDDFLGDIADIAGSESRLAWLREIKDPESGPWEEA